MAAAACSRHDARDDAQVTVREVEGFHTDSLGAGEIQIVSVDGEVDLVLARDSISGGLSPRTVAVIRQKVDTAAVKSTGFAGSIEKIVKTSVSSAIGTRASFPLSAVRDVRYEGGRLQFDWNGKPPGLFDNTKVNGKPVLGSFRPDDAQRFVEAVRARKLATGPAPLAQ